MGLSASWPLSSVVASGLSKKGCREKYILRPMLGTRAKRYKNRGFTLWGRVRALIFEVHCEARGANFCISAKNARKFWRENVFSRKIRESGFRVPNREQEICENLARNGFRLLRGSARSALIVANCGSLRAVAAKARANYAHAHSWVWLFEGSCLRFSFLWGWCGLKMTTRTGIFLGWGGMSFVDKGPNINSVCDLPGLFWGHFLCWGGFVGVHCYFLGWWWWFGCCCCCFFFLFGCCCFLVVVVVVVVVGCCYLAVSVFFLFFRCCCYLLFLLSLLFVCHGTPKGKNETNVYFPVFCGTPFPFFPFLFFFLIFSLSLIFFFPFLLESLDVVNMVALRQPDDIR